jgi:hypothetical protein
MEYFRHQSQKNDRRYSGPSIMVYRSNHHAYWYVYTPLQMRVLYEDLPLAITASAGVD